MNLSLYLYGDIRCHLYYKACVSNRTLKTGLENLYVIFLNSDFSFNIRSIPSKFLGDTLYNAPEGSVSQNFDLGPG